MPQTKNNILSVISLEEEVAAFEGTTDYPQGASNEAKRALKHKEENGSSCGTSKGWARARQLAARRPLSNADIKSIHSFLARHKGFDQTKFVDADGKEICGSIMFAAWGGDSMVKWAKNKAASIQENSEEVSYSYKKVEVGEDSYEVNTIGEGELHLQGDKAYFMYRLISETNVAVGTRYQSDFSTVSLADYVHLAKGIPFIIDHNDRKSTNAIGKVVHAYYSDDLDGTGIGGINGIIEIDTTLEYDGMSAMDIAKRIKLGYMYSGSVQVKYGWKQSHDTDNFAAKVGSKDEEGNYYRKMVTKIDKFYEFSGLAHGADPNAGLLMNDKQSYINTMRSSFSEKNKFNMVLIPTTETAAFGQSVLGEESPQEDNQAYATKFEEATKKVKETTQKLSDVESKLKAAEEKLQSQDADIVALQEKNKEQEKVIADLGGQTETFLAGINTVLKDSIVEYNKKVIKLQSLGEEIEPLPIKLEDTQAVADTVAKLTNNDLQKRIDTALGLYTTKEKSEPTVLALDNFEKRQEQFEQLFS